MERPEARARPDRSAATETHLPPGALRRRNPSALAGRWTSRPSDRIARQTVSTDRHRAEPVRSGTGDTRVSARDRSPARTPRCAARASTAAGRVPPG